VRFDPGVAQPERVRFSARRPPWLASALLVGTGLMGVISSCAHTGESPFVVVTERGVHEIDITGWAWLHLVVGAAVVVAGVAVLTGRRWAALVAIGCTVTAVAVGVLLFAYAPCGLCWWLGSGSGPCGC
jgi:putative Mn2+ efflux pump MntP